MLKLELPPTDEVADRAVDIRPKQVAVWLERLPHGSPNEAARQITGMLAAMNRAPIGDTERYRVLIQLHPAIARTAAHLEPQLAGAGVPPTQAAWQAGAQLRDLLRELGYGYKRVLLGLSGRSRRAGDKQRLIDVASLVLITLRDLQYAYYQTYTPLPQGLWRETHRVYHFTQDTGFADLPATAETATPSLIYRQALLLSLADPHRLEPAALLHTRRYVERFAALAELRSGLDSPGPMRFFIRREASQSAAQPLADEPRSGLWLHTGQLCQHLQTSAARLASGDPPRILGLPEGMEGESGQALLQRLQRSWRQRSVRNYRRTPAPAATLRLVAGVNAVHRLLLDHGNPAEAEGAEPTEINVSDSALPTAGATRTSTWELVNDSAGGVALAGMPELPHSLNIGDPLALQEAATGHWSLGVIRWIRMHDAREIEMGVERLSPSVEPVWIRPVRRRQLTRPQPALLLRGVAAQRRRDCLLLPPQVYRSARDVELLHDQQLDCVTFGPRLERTPSYDLVEFSRFQ